MADELKRLNDKITVVAGGSLKVGLGLYNSFPAALILLLPLGNWVDGHRTLLPAERSKPETGENEVNVLS